MVVVVCAVYSTRSFNCHIFRFYEIMTSLSVLRSHGLQLLRAAQGQPSLAPALQQLVRLAHTSSPDLGKSAIPARAESHGYTPFKVDFKQNKVEWALARVDDLVNWGRKVNDIAIVKLF